MAREDPKTSSAPESIKEGPYVREVESTYVLHRAKGLFLNSLDEQTILGWFKRGIPLESVRRGIERAFAFWQQNPEKAPRLVKAAHCEKFIQVAHARDRKPPAKREERAERTPSDESKEAPPAPDSSTASPVDPAREKLRLALCEALAQVGAREQNTHIRDAYRRTYRRIKELPADRKLRKRVWRLEKLLCDEVYQGLPPKERAEIDEKVKEALKKLSSAAEDAARAAFIAETRRQEIRKRYKLFHIEL